jgi:hypothetical protein
MGYQEQQTALECAKLIAQALDRHAEAIVTAAKIAANESARTHGAYSAPYPEVES